jgi:SAM-dependent methyltransferase
MDFVGQDLKGGVLEVGCGTGHWLRVLHGRGLRMAGVDASARMLAEAQSQAPGAVLLHGAAEHLPWASETFDRLFCINALHHFRGQIEFLAEAWRVLRPGGRLMTIGLDPHTGLDRWYIYEYFEPVLDIDRGRYPPSNHIRDWMHAVGFEDSVTSEVQHVPACVLARTAIEQGHLDKDATSQLTVLTDEQYRHGIDRVWRTIDAAEARGESLYLTADLRLYATYGSVPLA